jgi:hypothetical protein
MDKKLLFKDRPVCTTNEGKGMKDLKTYNVAIYFDSGRFEEFETEAENEQQAYEAGLDCTMWADVGEICVSLVEETQP